MGLKTKSILGIGITIDTKEKVLKEVGKWLKKPRTKDQKLGTEDKSSLIIFTPNPEIITYAQKDDNFRRIVNSAQINIPDGAGISWAMKKTYGLEIKRISGVDFMFDLCQLAQEKSLTIGLIGGRGGVAVDARECLRKKFPGLKVEVLEAGKIELRILNQELRIKNNKKKDNIHNSYFMIHDSKGIEIGNKKYFSNLTKELEQKKVDILFVALGCPKQEYFISVLSHQSSVISRHKPTVLMAVGGALDYISGRVPRAPEWMKKRGLEWLYRLIRQPQRLGRQLKGAEFFWKVSASSAS